MQRKHNKDIVPLAKELRRNMTKEERHLWYDFLRSYSVKFLRQKILGKYIVDFYSADARVVIELDGAQHRIEENEQYDAERTAFLEGYGLTVVRIPNEAINKDFHRICVYIDDCVKQSLSHLR